MNKAYPDSPFSKFEDKPDTSYRVSKYECGWVKANKKHLLNDAGRCIVCEPAEWR